MSKKTESFEQHLGELETNIVGMQYYDAEVRCGESVHLEREPDNIHDENAIRVENLDFEQVGHVPRQISAWLAPLIDCGMVRADGSVPAGHEDDEQRRDKECPLILHLFLTEKGDGILNPDPDPQDGLHALHEVVRRSYCETEAYSDPSVAVCLSKRLQLLAKRDVLPETRLLLALFPAKASLVQAKQRDRILEAVKAQLSTYRIGRALHHNNLTLFPLHHENGKQPPYVLLKIAIDAGTAEVEEVSDEGSVEEITIHNRGDQPILIPEGGILIGAKQNRIVNITIIIAAASTSKLPVTCVEQGRWSSGPRRFTSSSWGLPSVRRRKAETVRESRRCDGSARGDQGAVWEEVDHCLAAHSVSSPTANLTDVYENAEDQLSHYRSNLVLPENASGILVAIGDRVVGMDLFDSPRTMHECWNCLSDAYFMEAIGRKEKSRKTPRKAADEFMDRIAESVEICEKAVGIGCDLEIAGPALVGSAVWYQDSLCHLSAFETDGPSPPREKTREPIVTAKRKPRKCPQCGSRRIARIQYGYPDFSPALQRDLESGKIVLGGCVVTDHDPTWHCVDCEAQIHKETDISDGEELRVGS